MEWTPPPPATEDKPRDFFLEAGAVFSDTLPGEEIAMVDAKRPNTALDKFRMSQLRAAARSCSLTYSAFSGDYDGTYSAQRQELVEGYDGYRMLTGVFVSRFVRPVWERFIDMAIASGQLVVPAHIRPETIKQAEFRGPAMPWIDPKKEADALVIMTRAGIRSMQQVIAERGGRLQDTYEQIARERRLADELGLVFDSDARTDRATANELDPDDGSGRRSTDDPESGTRQRAARLRAVANGDT
jgi:lambda family phage portal protein